MHKIHAEMNFKNMSHRKGVNTLLWFTNLYMILFIVMDSLADTLVFDIVSVYVILVLTCQK